MWTRGFKVKEEEFLTLYTTLTMAAVLVFLPGDQRYEFISSHCFIPLRVVVKVKAGKHSGYDTSDTLGP